MKHGHSRFHSILVVKQVWDINQWVRVGSVFFEKVCPGLLASLCVFYTGDHHQLRAHQASYVCTRYYHVLYFAMTRPDRVACQRADGLIET